MRDLGAVDNLTVLVKDNLSGVVHEFYCTRPTNQQMVDYVNAMFKRKGSQISAANFYRVNVKFAADILVGFKKGTLYYNGKLMASDPEDPDYREDWKQLLVRGAGDLLDGIGRHVFQGAQVVSERESEEEPEEDSPLS